MTTGRRVVETALGDAVGETLKGDTLGAAIVESIDYFVFRDIESDEQALELFEFVESDEERKRIAASFRGARWQQKTGLVLARAAAHPAHAAQVRSQLIEYGAVVEYALRIMLGQNGSKQPPSTFDEIIVKARAAGILTPDGRAAADALRLARNRVHLWIDGEEKDLRAERDGRAGYEALTTVINECRAREGLPAWHFGRAAPVAKR